MAKLNKIEMKNGTSMVGYYNGKNYNGTIYINEYTAKGIDWKHSTKINFADVASITLYGNSDVITITTKTLPKTTAGWMAEMARCEE